MFLAHEGPRFRAFDVAVSVDWLGNDGGNAHGHDHGQFAQQAKGCSVDHRLTL